MLDQLIQDFCLLGGESKNIQIGAGKRGRGVFQTNPSEKSKIFIPQKLLLPIENIVISRQTAEIANQNKESPEERFALNYINYILSEKDFSPETIEDEFNPKNLPKELIQCMTKEPNIETNNLDSLIAYKLITTRAVNYKKLSAFAPIWDLVNHDHRAHRLETNHRGIGTPHTNSKSQDHELLHRYNLISSPLGRAIKYKFTCEETFCLSLPFKFKIPKTENTIQCLGDQTPGEKLKTSANLKAKSNLLTFTALPIASLQQDLPIEFFIKHITLWTQDRTLTIYLLSKIIDFNVRKRKSILSQLEKGIKSNYINTLQKALRTEITMLEHQFQFLSIKS